MKTKLLIITALFFSLFIQAKAQEGHVKWWWDSKSADFIVEGKITYDPANYYELSPVNVKEKDRKYYWIVGNLKINKIVFINKDSQHLESYQQFLKNMDKDYPVLIPAIPRWQALDDKNKKMMLMTLLGYDIPNEPTLINLSQINIFPILDLTLESAVPKENTGEAMELIGKRTNNYLAVNNLK